MKTCYDKSHLPVRYENFVAMNVSSFEIKKTEWEKSLEKNVKNYLRNLIPI